MSAGEQGDKWDETLEAVVAEMEGATGPTPEPHPTPLEVPDFGEPSVTDDGFEVQAAHTGFQCHEAHPGIPHRRPLMQAQATPGAPPSRGTDPLAAMFDPPTSTVSVARGDVAAVVLGSDAWTRYDLWAERAWAMAAAAIEQAKVIGERNAKAALSEEVRCDPSNDTMMDAARMAADLAAEACPMRALSSGPEFPEFQAPEIRLGGPL